jgi:plastocyanin
MWDLAKRRWPFVAVAAMGLVAAGYGAAANVAVVLGPSGPQPSAVTVPWGGTVDFVNGDSVPHGLTSARPGPHVAAIAPGETFSDVISGRAGPYAYHQTGGPRRDGTVVIAVSGSVSLRAAANPVPFGKRLRLSGTTKAGLQVALAERLAGEPHWHAVETLTSGSQGTFGTTLPLAAGGRFRASIEGDQIRSHRLVVTVAPSLTLTASSHRVAAGKRVRLHARVRPARAASRVYLYICSPLAPRWHRLVRARFSARGVASFRGRAVPGRFRLRATLRRHDVAAGYSPVTSRPVTVRGTGKSPLVTHRSRRYC